MKRRELKALIGLGRGGMRRRRPLTNDLPVLVGCVVSVPRWEARNPIAQPWPSPFAAFRAPACGWCRRQ